MPSVKRALLIGGAVCVWSLFSYAVAVYALAFWINQFGLSSLRVFVAPRDAYVIARGRRHMHWHGVEIRVDSPFVLDSRNGSVLVHRVLNNLPLLAPGVVFVDKRTGRARFNREQSWCASANDRCTVYRTFPFEGGGLCLQRRGTRAKASMGGIEIWQCRLPNGVEAIYGCDRHDPNMDCESDNKVVRDAFATWSIEKARSERTE